MCKSSLYDKYRIPPRSFTDTGMSRFQVTPLTDEQLKINPSNLLPLLYLACLSHPLIVCGLPSAATANAGLDPLGVMFDT